MFKIIANLVTLSDRASIDQQVSKIFKYKIVSGRVISWCISKKIE